MTSDKDTTDGGHAQATPIIEWTPGRGDVAKRIAYTGIEIRYGPWQKEPIDRDLFVVFVDGRRRSEPMILPDAEALAVSLIEVQS